MLTHSELNLLSQLTALPLPVSRELLPITVEDMAHFHSRQVEKLAGDAAMSSEEWRHSLNLVLNNPKLTTLQILDCVHQPQNGLFGLCFTSDIQSNGIVTFRGTVGLGGWIDNYKGGFITATPQQKNALLFVQMVHHKFGFSTFDLAGHSKGGNNAQYITVLYGDYINRCITFNSPGFSADFIAKYYPEIQKAKDKIVAYEGSGDIVNILLTSIAGKRIIIDTGTRDPKNNHKPNHILDEEGHIGHTTPKRHLVYNTVQLMTMGLSCAIAGSKKERRKKRLKRKLKKKRQQYKKD